MTMPNFLIIGAAKAGTTALYQFLKQHPQIYMSSLKEPHFFAFEGETLDFQGPRDQLGVEHMLITDIEPYRALFQKVSQETAIGEASAMYLYSPKAPERIQHHIPDAKLIAILRDPVERAYSSFLHLVRDDREPFTDFAQALRDEETRIQKNWMPIWHYQQMGFYYAQLQRYFDRFKQSQIKVYLYEDLNANPTDLVQDIYRFLGVDAAFAPDVSQKYNVSGIHGNKIMHAMHAFLINPHPAKSILKPLFPKELRRSVIGQLANSLRNKNLVKPQFSAETRQQLIQLYREDILRLQDLIQRDLSKWLE